MVFTTTRHAASLRSSNNCKCLIEMFFIARGESPLHKRLTPYGPFSAVSPLEYGGLKPILPFLEGRSDAACRVAIWPSRLPPMEPYGLYNDAAPNRDAVRCVATNAPPPYARTMPTPHPPMSPWF